MARYPAFQDLKRRMESFGRSFPIIGISPFEFADAGFYSIGIQDYTRCFYCGVGLRGWDDTDDPWKQHAKFSLSCKYLQDKKGRAFVQLQEDNKHEHVSHPESGLKGNDASNIQQNDASSSTRKLSEEEIILHVKGRMDHPIQRLLLMYAGKLGFSESSLKDALTNQLSHHADDFESMEEVIQALIISN